MYVVLCTPRIQRLPEKELGHSWNIFSDYQKVHYKSGHIG